MPGAPSYWVRWQQRGSKNRQIDRLCQVDVSEPVAPTRVRFARPMGCDHHRRRRCFPMIAVSIPLHLVCVVEVLPDYPLRVEDGPVEADRVLHDPNEPVGLIVKHRSTDVASLS